MKCTAHRKIPKICPNSPTLSAPRLFENPDLKKLQNPMINKGIPKHLGND
jgi:hypothetical protein